MDSEVLRYGLWKHGANILLYNHMPFKILVNKNKNRNNAILRALIMNGRFLAPSKKYAIIISIAHILKTIISWNGFRWNIFVKDTWQIFPLCFSQKSVGCVYSNVVNNNMM